MIDQLVTANVATNLYWLGRYLERTEATLHKILKAYDKIIDVKKEAGEDLYKKFDIKLKYENANDFLYQAILGEHGANLLEIMSNARESAIICRHRIDSAAFGEIIELHALFTGIEKNKIEIDYKLIDHAHSLLSEIWGALSKREHKNKNRSDLFFRMGKLVEKADFRLRFNKDETVTMRVIKEIDDIVKKLSDDEASQESSKKRDKKVDLLSEVNKKIDAVIVE
ncbi:MAG: alpha-E domain-containing protein [Campylobacterota bacterium]|nr:alpha-E domain-containing protein [Campylobacterota bacterium]